MYFKRLEMQGFKSFADPVIIDFHEGITCIVGPNGSGKSTISDAIRWVLGEQSPKALRGGKMEEVIFAGTASRKSRGMAEVVLVIDNSERILDIDYSEVSITRRMYRSGESEYLINNNPCRLRDIRELIMDTGIGVDGYSIIGQGKIADIVSTKPEARREIFEEAAGIVMYKGRRAEAERKLESTNANLERVKDIITEIENRIDGLREDSIKAKEYLELRERYRTLEVNVILRNIENIEQTGKVYKDDLERLAKEIEETTKNHEVYSADNSRLSERRELLDKLSGETRDDILRLVQEINEITNKAQLSAERLSGIDKETEIIRTDILALKELLAQEEASMNKLTSEEEALSKEIASAKEKLEEQIIQYNEAAAIRATTAEIADEGRRTLFELSKEKASCESEIKGIDNFVENLTDRKSELDQLFFETGKISDILNSTVEEKKAEKERKEKEKEDLQVKKEEIRKLREETSLEIKSLEEEIEREKLEISKHSSRRRTMEEMEANYEGYFAGVKAVMTAGIPGLKGTVAELMDVPKGYELAIETSLGANLQNIICDTDEDAKRGVNYLKEKKAGRATFLPVGSIKKADSINIDPVKNEPGFIDLAVNMVKYDEKYSAIFSQLFRRIAVTDNMDSAIRLSKKGAGLILVTPEGEIVNPQGGITGGTFRNKTANILERKAEINQLAEEIKKSEEIISKGQGSLSEERQSLSSLMIREQETEAESHRIEVELSALVSDIKGISENLDKETVNKERHKNELERISEQLAETEGMKDKQIARIKEIEGEIEEIDKSISDAMEKSENQRVELEAKSEAVTAARIALNQIETRGESQSRLMDRVKEQIASYGSQIRDKEKAIAALEEERKALVESSVNDVDIEDKLSQRSTLEESLAELQSEREALVRELRTIEEQQGEAAQKINDLRDQRYQIEVRTAKGETQLENFKEKLWEEFEITYAQAAEMRTDDFVFTRATKETREIRARMRELGDVNIGAIAEYEEVSERYTFLTDQRDDINKARVQLEDIIADMDKTIKVKFKENFDKVVDNFRDIFVELFGGGQAELRLENEEDPLNSGIEIVAQPPGKKLQNINLMSGGEKTMTAIALMFAVLKTKPTPFCILDEVEAALDDNNIDRFANYLKNFREIQFTLVTHQKATMEHADVLYGVTMPEHGISRMLSLRLGDKFDLD